jgi:carboxylesterase type B
MSWTIFLFFIVINILFLSSIFDSTFAVQLLNTSSGIYVGRTANYDNIIVQQYLGIEYGRVNKRFDRAAPILRKDDQIIQATSLGPLCKPTAGSCVGNTGMYQLTPYCSVSYGIFSIKSIPAEQCLFLNVFIPVTTRKKKKKAIFMWIHGGSGQVGTGNVFDGTILAGLGDIIVVTFNFRLNLFGFLSSGDERLEGNLGLYDQALVLDWIYANADALGGDVRRITVGGHSAGAPNAYYLATSPLNNGRIRRLLLQSGSPFNIWSHIKARDAMEKFNIVANDNGCGNLVTFDEKLQCLESRDFNSIAEHEHHSYTSANHTNVVASGNFMSQFREEFQENDTLSDVDILMGATDDEGKMICKSIVSYCFVLLGVYVAIVPILMEQSDQEVITLNNVNFTDIALKFLVAMQPDKTCLHHKALEL